MSSSPLNRNYIYNIHHIKIQKPVKKKQKINYIQKIKNIKIYSNCISKRINSQIQSKDYYQLNLFQNGMFNINKIHLIDLQKNKIIKQNINNKSGIISKQRLIKSVYFFPTQTIAQCQYNIENKIHKEMILYNPGQYLIIKNYKNGLLDQQQYNFNLKEMNVTVSIYQKDKLQLINQYFYQPITQNNDKQKFIFNVKLENYFKDKKFCKEIYQLTEGKFQWLKEISFSHQNSIYYGQVNNQTCVPEGLGLLVNRIQIQQQNMERKRLQSDNQEKSISQFKLNPVEQTIQQNVGWEIYFGNFQKGILQKIGSIWFKQRNIYFGQFQFGSFTGFGQYFQYGAQSENQGEYFYYRVDNKIATQSNFAQFMRETFFNGKQKLEYGQNFQYVSNQYQKLKLIYAPAKKVIIQRDQNIFQQQLRRKFNKDQQKQQISKIQSNEGVNDSIASSKRYDLRNQEISFNMTSRGSANENVRLSKQTKNLLTASNVPNERGSKNSVTNLMKSLVKQNSEKIFNSHQNSDIYIHNFQNESSQQASQKLSNEQFFLGCQQVKEFDKKGGCVYDDTPIQKQYFLQGPKRMNFPNQFMQDSNRRKVDYDGSAYSKKWNQQNKVQKNPYEKLDLFFRQPQKRLFHEKFNERQQIDNNKIAIENFDRMLNKGKIRRIFANNY